MVLGIAQDRRRARALFKPPRQRRRPKRPYPAPLSQTSLTPGARASYGGQYVTPDQLHRVETSIYNGLLALTKQSDEHRDDVAYRILKQVDENDADLRGNLREMLGATVRDRALGAGLLGVGILLSVAGSVLSTAS